MYTQGSVTWGHDTGVVEDNVRDFAVNWTGTGAISGAADAEKLELETGEYMESELVETGVRNVQLLQNNYQAADTVTLKYRTGATDVDTLAAAWQVYAGIFISAGYVQIRVEATI